MPDKSTIRKFIRHPVDVPIHVTADSVENENDDTMDQTITNGSLGGLAFVSHKPLQVLARVQICIPFLKKNNTLVGNVVWCDRSSHGYEIGIEFESSKDAFRLRMIEQICHIEHYRKEILLQEGRELTTQEAASEWLAKYADDFPTL